MTGGGGLGRVPRARDGMSPHAAPDPGPFAAALAGYAARAGEAEWAQAAAALATGPPPGDAAGEPPTYRDLALTGLALVDALARGGRWPEARLQAEFLSDYFTAARKRLHAVAGIGFQGLLTAVRGHDLDEMDDMAEFLREVFRDGREPAGEDTG